MIQKKIAQLKQYLEKTHGELKLHSKTTNRTLIFINQKEVVKVYLSRDRQARFNRELGFYKRSVNSHIPKLISTLKYATYPILVIQDVETAYLSPLTDEILSTLTAEDFIRILNALLEIQSVELTGVIVHGDLAPHNIFLDKDSLFFVDWDNYHLAKLKYMRMYDFATLWAWIYLNPEYMKEVFEKVKIELQHRGLYEDFMTCYSLRIRNLSKDKTKIYPERGKEMFDYILRNN
jgi:serine/threonine protein kinase